MNRTSFTKIAALYTCLITLVWSAGICGCGTSDQSQPSQTKAQTPVIETQPLSQTIPIGDFATFTVNATGTAPLSYQWMMNGSPIAGANATTYSTPDLTASDSGEKYSIVVSNSAGEANSDIATLTVGPRSPMPGDLRFQQVDAPSESDQGMDIDTLTTGVPVGVLSQNSNSTGSPLELGDVCVAGYSYDCIWGVWITTLPAGQSGLSFYTYGGNYADFDTDLANGIAGTPSLASATEAVITSLDFEPDDEAYAIAWSQLTQGSAFDLRREVVAPNSVSTTVATDASESRVVTAVSYDDSTGQVDLLSYGWEGDTTSLYDTTVVEVGASDVGSAAEGIAEEGYILTAFGGNNQDGYILVGTKVRGDTMPRPIILETSSSSPAQNAMAGYAPVAWVTYPGPDNEEEWTMVYEK